MVFQGFRHNFFRIVAAVFLQLLKGEKELNVLATENQIQPNLLRNWKKEFLANASLAFDNKREDNLREKLAEERKENDIVNITLHFFLKDV